MSAPEWRLRSDKVEALRRISDQTQWNICPSNIGSVATTRQYKTFSLKHICLYSSLSKQSAWFIPSKKYALFGEIHVFEFAKSMNSRLYNLVYVVPERDSPFLVHTSVLFILSWLAVVNKVPSHYNKPKYSVMMYSTVTIMWCICDNANNAALFTVIALNYLILLNYLKLHIHFRVLIAIKHVI